VQMVLKSLKLVAQEPSKWTPAVAKLAASRESNRAVLKRPPRPASDLFILQNICHLCFRLA
jgi:hypothetical protein